MADETVTVEQARAALLKALKEAAENGFAQDAERFASAIDRLSSAGIG